MTCTHETYNKDCTTCRDAISQYGYGVKSSGLDPLDIKGDSYNYTISQEDWAIIWAYYNKGEPEPDEAPEYDFDGSDEYRERQEDEQEAQFKAREEANNSWVYND